MVSETDGVHIGLHPPSITARNTPFDVQNGTSAFLACRANAGLDLRCESRTVNMHNNNLQPAMWVTCSYTTRVHSDLDPHNKT